MESVSDAVYYFKLESEHLRKEPDLLPATIINLDRRIKHMDSEITDFKGPNPNR